jgi:hypothetical protein
MNGNTLRAMAIVIFSAVYYPAANAGQVICNGLPASTTCDFVVDMTLISADPDFFIADAFSAWSISLDSGAFEIFNSQLYPNLYIAPGSIGSLVQDTSGNTGINDFLPATTLHIRDAGTPAITLDNSVTTWQLAMDSSAFVIGKLFSGVYPFGIFEGAPTSSLVIAASGNVGVGEGAPAAPLSVTRSDGTAKLKVEENLPAANPSAPQTMLELRRSGAVRFDLVDESNGKTWIFQNRNGAFDITLQGTGVQEFKVDPSGNLTIQGALIQLSDVNRKEDFQNFEGESVLESLRHLPISKWRYKGDTTGNHHIGPMAQDFHEVFRLGESDTTIAPLDVAGVAVAGVKELDERVGATDARIEELADHLKQKDRELQEMRQQVRDLEARIDRGQPSTVGAGHKTDAANRSLPTPI